MGERGPAGAAAGSGASVAYRPHYWVGCATALDLISPSSSGSVRGTDGIAESGLNYSVIIYSNHDVDATCGAGLGAAQSDGLAQYYPSNIPGAKTGFCAASIDYPPIGMVAGFWDFEIDDNGPHATYVDPDNPLGLNGFSYRFTQNECNANVLGNDATWTKVTLADVF